MGDEKILSYNDVVLRRSDLGILRGPHYINDRIIEFYFSYLSSYSPSHDILLVPPSISFWITNCPDIASLKDAVEPLKLPEKNLVIFTINDNDDVTVAEGGLHWSLLAYHREMNAFVYHDSIAGLNRCHAQKLYRVVKGFLGDSGPTARFVEGFTPQQANGYDCGLFVMAIAKAICLWHVAGSKDKDQWYSVVKEEVSTSVVGDMRNEILVLIQSLMDKK